jgi:hypothetical protein
MSVQGFGFKTPPSPRMGQRDGSKETSLLAYVKPNMILSRALPAFSDDDE